MFTPIFFSYYDKYVIIFSYYKNGGLKMAQALVQSVDRALRILELLIEENQSMNLSEISEEVDLNISTVHRLLNTLIYRGFVAKEETGRYKLGVRIFEIVSLLEDSLDLKAIVRPYLNEIVDECNETANLVILDRGEVVYIDQVESTNLVRMFANIGSKGPAHSLGAGKVLLAHLDERELDKMLKGMELTQFTSETLTEVEELKENLKQIKVQGYAIDFEEMEEGVRCVAAPIKNGDGEVIAAISVSGPNIRITDKFLYNKLIPLVTSKAIEISKNIGSIRVKG
ncbi:IclR family transcriptional regulator [Orenia metallireducens]|jgi:DNA-binding IclR family transcriptional regulator|uniref:Glycerol operon regulatory protein n=2 Tax=Orenia metallireducens TaxID=1413210 RepID=A0A285GNE4_9FIRM|nr:IclR family transcriptional regulator [Orenia metallireducens]SNY23861.1 transcriptional regulator, IclR family [Orenia metallireducens]